MPNGRIGLLTGGGDCPGLNAVIRAVVRTAILRYDYEVLGFVDGFDGLVRPEKVRSLQLSDVHHILPLGGTVLGTTNRSNPFNFKVAQGDKTVFRDMSDAVIANCNALDLDGVIVIGGDGTLTIASELGKKGFNAVGVPKTIDNDLEATDVTFGFDSAVSTAVDALDKLKTTAESHQRVMILELMGRNAGWISVYAGLAGGAHVILIPEIPYDIDQIVHKIESREHQQGRNYTLIVVAEGARSRGDDLEDGGDAEPIHSTKHEGAGERLRGLLSSRLGDRETRVTVLGHLQRGGSPTPTDRNLGTRFGVHAVECVKADRFDHMVALRNGRVTSVPLSEAAGLQRLVPIDHPMLHTIRQIGISLGV
jgi:6-phosphofructokinase 1